uniref:V-type proton ATPase subunit a n=1 Tax=Pelodiscus sinensis TaxID=13735 RepID=K7G0Z9_PELSI
MCCLCPAPQLNPNVNAFQRRFVGEVRRCEDMEKTFTFLHQELRKAGLALDPCPESPRAPLPRDALLIQDQSEQLAQELREVSRNRESLSGRLRELREQGRTPRLREHSPSPSGARTREGPPNAPSVRRGRCRSSWDFPSIQPKCTRAEALSSRCCSQLLSWEGREAKGRMEGKVGGREGMGGEGVSQEWGAEKGGADYPQGWAVMCVGAKGGLLAEKGRRRGDTVVLGAWQKEKEGKELVAREGGRVLWHWLPGKGRRKVPWHCLPGKERDTMALVAREGGGTVALVARHWLPGKERGTVALVAREGEGYHGTGCQVPRHRLPGKEGVPWHWLPEQSHAWGCGGAMPALGAVGLFHPGVPAPPHWFSLLSPPPALWRAGAARAGGAGAVRERRLHGSVCPQIWKTFFEGRYLILLMGAFSIYTGLIYNECFSKATAIFPSAWSQATMVNQSNWRSEYLARNAFLSLNPNVTGVFRGPYPFGIDPIWSMANNHLNFLNSFKMKMSVILGIVHMSFGVLLGVFNHVHFKQPYKVVLVFLPEVVFLLALFGYLVFMIFYKWFTFSAVNSLLAPSILIHFIDMFLFTENPENHPLYPGQDANPYQASICSHFSLPPPSQAALWPHHTLPQTHSWSGGKDPTSRSPMLLPAPGAALIPLGSMAEPGLGGSPGQLQMHFEFSEVFMHQAIHTIEYCLGCISNTASYLRLWALSLAHAPSYLRLWALSLAHARGAGGEPAAWLSCPAPPWVGEAFGRFWEQLSALTPLLCVACRVEFQNKFYVGAGYKLTPFTFPPDSW